MICTPGELHGMDMGVHMAVMEEWNEGHEFGWQDALVVNVGGFYVRVAQPDRDGCLYVATYIGGGEGDLMSLRVYDPVARTHDKGRGIKIPELARVDAKIGHEMWWSNHMEDRLNTRPKGGPESGPLGEVHLPNTVGCGSCGYTAGHANGCRLA